MKNGLISLFAVPFIIGLAGCASTPIVKEEKFLPPPKIEEKYSPPKNKEYNRAILAQSDFPIFCDCPFFSETLYEVDEYLRGLRKDEQKVLKELRKKSDDRLKIIELEIYISLQERMIENRDILLEAGEKCGCYKRKL